MTEEAEKYFEDFLSNVEDTDISSIDGERSDTSSSLGGMHKQREVARHVVERTEGYQGREGCNSLPAQMDGVNLPWLQWETSNDGSPLPGKINAQLPVTPKSLMWNGAQVFLNRYISFSIFQLVVFFQFSCCCLFVM